MVEVGEKRQLPSRPHTCPRCGATSLIPPLTPREGFYFRARAWVAASPHARAAISENRARDFRRIAALGDTWGLRLDELGASYRMVRWCGAPKYTAEREARYRALVNLLAEHRDAPELGRMFGELARTMPKVGRAALRRGRGS